MMERAIAVDGSGSVSSILLRPDGARALLVFAHGAGADMRHGFMEGVARALAGHAIATLRYQFPYAEKGSRRPDRAPVCEATVRAAVAAAAALAPELPLLAGGKSMGGRMTSQAQAAAPLPSVRGLVFFGFPLHPAGEPSTARAEHLPRVALPMLFLQGTRDDLADLELLRPVLAALGPRAELSILDGADHSFGVGRPSGVPARSRRAAGAAGTGRARPSRRGDAAIAELAARAAAFVLKVAASTR